MKQFNSSQFSRGGINIFEGGEYEVVETSMINKVSAHLSMVYLHNHWLKWPPGLLDKIRTQCEN